MRTMTPRWAALGPDAAKDLWSEDRTVALGLSLVLCLFLAQTPVTSQEAEEIQAASVDFRMAPLEQAKKIVRQTRSRGGATVTLSLPEG